MCPGCNPGQASNRVGAQGLISKTGREVSFFSTRLPHVQHCPLLLPIGHDMVRLNKYPSISTHTHTHMLMYAFDVSIISTPLLDLQLEGPSILPLKGDFFLSLWLVGGFYKYLLSVTDTRGPCTNAGKWEGKGKPFFTVTTRCLYWSVQLNQNIMQRISRQKQSQSWHVLLLKGGRFSTAVKIARNPNDSSLPLENTTVRRGI